LERAPPIGTRTRLLLQGGSVPFRLSPFEGVILLAVLGVTMFGGYTVYARLSDLNAPVPTPPVYFEAQRTTLTSTVSTTGTVQSSQQVTLTFGTTGKIKEFLVGLGAQVKTGQPLARIDDTDVQQSARSAQSNLDSAVARYNAAVEGPSATDVATALQAVNNARGQLATAQQNLARQVRTLEGENARLREELAVFERTLSTDPKTSPPLAIQRFKVDDLPCRVGGEVRAREDGDERGCQLRGARWSGDARHEIRCCAP